MHCTVKPVEHPSFLEIRDVTANLLTEVCHDVVIEPDLQPLTGEVMDRVSANTTNGARLDIAVNGLWGGRGPDVLRWYHLQVLVS